jgi:hypothetical protein
VDGWRITSRQFISGREEDLVSKVAKARGHEAPNRREDTKERGGTRTVH